ncbi:unnamed protein product [Candida verbasci]|uniref:YMC020W-like alpha/beta hydrolase domain-containing protein n=1 Tax=Candida verbasci TaxID=1227364 RepID=A0A9W4TVI4_9ASCO|nr:unnamed protein product [Candida verbasci]
MMSYFWNSRPTEVTNNDNNTNLKEGDNNATPTNNNSNEIKQSSSESSEIKSKVNEDNNNKRKLSSTNSLPSMTSGNWLNWNNRKESQKFNDNNNNEENVINEDDENINDNEDIENEDDTQPDDNGDEVDDHVNSSKKKGINWSFWSSNNNNGTNGNESSDDNKNNGKQESPPVKKEKSPPASIANTILNSKTPSVPSKQDLSNEQQDDAVLYKPHYQADQFNQINTHKNENLKGNLIVPDWSTCLPEASTSHIFQNYSTSNQANANQTIRTDLKNWRQFLNQISSKFGFSGSLPHETDHSQPQQQPQQQESPDVEKEFGLLYERSYKLYGKSLALLPKDKRACLPNYNKYYHNIDSQYSINHTPTQYEEDESDPNSISITNDAMGNLLINSNGNNKPKRIDNKNLNTEIVNHKSGPLKKIKNILIIGVHGFFPTKMIRPIIGAPKGTSLKFANEAEKSIIRYCIENNLINESESTVSIQKIALEKEGKIFDRVHFFTEILQKWENELNQADFIFIASHSQGCVVSIILLSRLIRMGILKDPIHKRIGLLGMAGINNGPFYGVDKSFFMKAYSAIEHDSLNELFELTKFDSPQSVVYKESIKTIINSNVKLCFVGSINDQLVPLYSALASHVFHPNIYRACYIDYSSQTPKFIEKLISLCSNLMNLGFYDNNVIKELSTSLAGPLTAGGHSKIYNDGKVYDLGIKFVLDTDDIVIPYNGEIDEEDFDNSIDIPISNQVYIKEFNVGKIGTNPFILPWCLRGLIFNVEKNWPNRYYKQDELEDDNNNKKVFKNGYEEIHELYEIFEHWKPDSKVLKDLKFRLNGLRASKL